MSYGQSPFAIFVQCIVRSTGVAQKLRTSCPRYSRGTYARVLKNRKEATPGLAFGMRLVTSATRGFFWLALFSFCLVPLSFFLAGAVYDRQGGQLLYVVADPRGEWVVTRRFPPVAGPVLLVGEPFARTSRRRRQHGVRASRAPRRYHLRGQGEF